MYTTCGHYNSSKAGCSQCGLRRSWAEVVKGEQQTCSTTPPSQSKEEIKAMEAALAGRPDNVDLFGKVRATLEERLQHARKEARDSKPLDQRLEGCRGALQRASKAKQVAIAQQQAAQAAFEKVEADESRIRAELAELEKQAHSQTTQPTCLQTISCKAAPLSAAVTEISRHIPETEASIISTCVWDCDDEHLDLGTPDDVLLDTPQTRLRRRCAGNAPYGQTSRRWESHGSDGKHSRMTPMTVVSANVAALDRKAERAAARAGLCQGQRAEELERMFDDAGADVISLQEHRLQTTGQRCGGLFQQVYSSASPYGTLGVALWFRRSPFKKFD